MTDQKTKLSVEERMEHGLKGIAELKEMVLDYAPKLSPLDKILAASCVIDAAQGRVNLEIQLRQAQALERIADELLASANLTRYDGEANISASVGEAIDDQIIKARVRRAQRGAEPRG